MLRSNVIYITRVMDSIGEASEIKEDSAILNRELSDLFTANCRRIVDRWGSKKKNSSEEHFETDPVRLPNIEGEEVDIILHSGKDQNNFSIQAKIVREHGPFRMLYSSKKQFQGKIKDWYYDNATSEKIFSGLKLLFLIEKSLSRKAANKILTSSRKQER